MFEKEDKRNCKERPNWLEVLVTHEYTDCQLPRVHFSFIVITVIVKKTGERKEKKDRETVICLQTIQKKQWGKNTQREEDNAFVVWIVLQYS